MLQNTEHTWLVEQNQLREHTVQFFRELYQSNGPRNFEPVIDQLPDPICPLCHFEKETVEHLFLLCLWTRQIRDTAHGGCHVVEYMEGQKSGGL